MERPIGAVLDNAMIIKGAPPWSVKISALLSIASLSMMMALSANARNLHPLPQEGVFTIFFLVGL